MPNKLQFKGRYTHSVMVIEWFDLPLNKRFTTITGRWYERTYWMN